MAAKPAMGRTRLPSHVEWPTVALLLAVYGAFALVTWHYAQLPLWLVLPCAAFLVCLQGSLQHEVVHGHPTPWNWVNEALVLPCLWLWMPFRTYRRLHLVHHSDENLTDPEKDPESYYLTPEAWRACGRVARAYLWCLNTVAGRLLLGPLHATWQLYRAELPRLLRGEGQAVREWLPHLLGTGLVLAWAVGICGIPLLDYLLFFAYPGTALTLLRSYLEHRAVPVAAERSVIIEAGPVMSLLFLNNNLHALHHAEPGLAWYRLPARFRERRAALLAGNGSYHFRGYWEVVARYLLWPKEAPVHIAGQSSRPSGETARATPTFLPVAETEGRA